jgi:hypothetical protein
VGGALDRYGFEEVAGDLLGLFELGSIVRIVPEPIVMILARASCGFGRRFDAVTFFIGIEEKLLIGQFPVLRLSRGGADGDSASVLSAIPSVLDRAPITGARRGPPNP